MSNFYRLVRIYYIIFFLLLAQLVSAQWPKVIPVPNEGKITIYQPQNENLFGDKLAGRAAIAIQKTGKDPVFGAIFYLATIVTDKVSRTASIEKITITSAKFPGLTDSNQVIKLGNILQAELPKWNLEISLEDLVTSLSVANVSEGVSAFKNDPPKIFYKNKPTTLVILAGEPKIQKDKSLNANRVVNTPSLIFQDGSKWNMYSGGIWYQSDSITSGWSQNKSLSGRVAIINDTIRKREKERKDVKDTTAKPEVTDILVSTVPAELLQTKGKPV